MGRVKGGVWRKPIKENIRRVGMDIERFDELATKTKLQDRALAMAKGMLVYGEKSIDIGRREGVTRQLVEQAKNRILRQLRMEEKKGKDWVTVTAVLPRGMANIVDYIEKREKERYGKVVAEKSMPPPITAGEIEILAELIAGRKI